MNEAEDIAAARSACRAEGMDPDFVGTKGYPNWKNVTRQSSVATRKMIEDCAALFAEKEPSDD